MQAITKDSDKPHKANGWLQVIITGFVLYVLSVVFLIITQNPNLFPTVVMIGSFLVPVAYVTFFYERRHISNLSLSTTLIGFIYGGILGVLAASILEPIFVRSLTFPNTFVIGLIEEGVKILGVLFIARRWRHDAEMDGLILGAAAGMGFAAFESSGYAFNAFLTSGGSLSSTVFVTLLRGILSPVGHGTWTAILASVLFRESREGHFHINLKVIGAYLLVSALHGLWDGLPTLITSLLGSGLDVFIGQAAVGLTGLSILWFLWRDARRLQLEAQQSQVSEEVTPIENPE
ncbi:MAG: PrsW family intramembrane metalloprotease [Chloroflexi bacterium]|nr:PrsW family intramembrane metalloprotease [Chloroflexota bacterium]